MAKMPSMQFYPGDWMKDPALRACSLSARGLWIDMICLMFEAPIRGYLATGEGKPYTEKQISRMVGCDSGELEQALAELTETGALSIDKNGTIFCRRIVRDEIARIDKSKKLSEAGRRGASARWGGDGVGHAEAIPEAIGEAIHQAIPNAISQDMAIDGSSSSSSSSTSCSSSELKPKRKRTRKKHGEDDPLFMRFWEAYPRKVERLKAHKAWCKAVKGTDPETIIEAVVEYAESPAAIDLQFVKYPASWLNAERWADDRAEWNRKSNSKGSSTPQMTDEERKAKEQENWDELFGEDERIGQERKRLRFQELERAEKAQRNGR